MPKTFLITVSGMDGAGKSTQLNRLQALLAARNYRAMYLWSRGGYTSLFNGLKMVLRRFGGKRLPAPGVSEQRQAYLQRSGVRRLWLTLALLDLIRLYCLNVRAWRWLGRSVVCDRYIWDTLIDFRLSFPEENIERWLLWRLLVRSASHPDLAFLLMIPAEESLRRSHTSDRVEPFPDSLEVRMRRYDEYLQLQRRNVWTVVIDTCQPPDLVWSAIADDVERLMRRAVGDNT